MSSLYTAPDNGAVFDCAVCPLLMKVINYNTEMIEFQRLFDEFVGSVLVPKKPLRPQSPRFAASACVSPGMGVACSARNFPGGRHSGVLWGRRR